MNLSSEEFLVKLLSVQKSLFRVALIWTANTEDAKDLVQETTIRAWENREKYDERDNFQSWVFTIMRNIFLNRMRRMQLEPISYGDYDVLASQSKQFSSETPESGISLAEIMQAIRSLPDEYQTPFLMLVAGFKYEEIAEELHIPVGTVKSRIFFARKRLQRLLIDYKW